MIIYMEILSAGTFTHGHLGPNIFGELLKIVNLEDNCDYIHEEFF